MNSILIKFVFDLLMNAEDEESYGNLYDTIYKTQY